MKRFVVTTGGTGGHIFPALAVAEACRLRYPEVDIVFAGGWYGREKDLAEKAGLVFFGLPVRGFSGRGLRGVWALSGLGLAAVRAWIWIKKYRPEAVLGFGGYASVAPLLAALAAGVPCAIHEQNSVPGAANRWLGKWVSKVFLSSAGAASFFDAQKTVVTGNPVRQALVNLPGKQQKAQEHAAKTILILGGSLGAHALNRVIVDALQDLYEAGFSLLHQTGEADYAFVCKAYEEAGIDSQRAEVQAFIEDMAQAYARADIAICRAGATTVAELAVTGTPAVLVPFPYATHDHQQANAREMEQAGAAVLIRQDGLSAQGLKNTLTEIFEAPHRLACMSQAAKKLGRPDATHHIMEQLARLIHASPEYSGERQ